jgi:hypothetical protein
MKAMTNAAAALFFEAAELEAIVQELTVSDELQLVLVCVLADVVETASLLLDVALRIEQHPVPEPTLTISEDGGVAFEAIKEGRPSRSGGSEIGPRRGG